MYKRQVRLGVIAPVADVFVLPKAVGAHGKGIHRRAAAVIGQAADDRVARPAVGAVDKRIAEAAVPRRKQLFFTVRTRRGIRSGKGRFLSLIHILGVFEKAGAERGKTPAVSVNWAQAVIRVEYTDQKAGMSVVMEEANEGERQEQGE